MVNESITGRRVLISGASIGGPALAFWLSRYGFEVTVVELAPELRTGGYKVDVRGTAVKVAERMGIMEDIRKASTAMRESTFVNRKNKPIVTFPADLMGGRFEGDDEIMRGDLAAILYQHTKNEVEYIFNDSITALNEQPDGVEVTFKRGETRTFDIVVGADGLHSNVRALAFGEESQFAQHLGAYVTIFTAPNLLNLNHSEIYYGSVGRGICIYSVDPREAKNLFIFQSEPLNYNYRDVEQQKQIVASKFRGNDWKIPQLLEPMWNTPDFYFDSISLIKMERWSRGRVVLLGDAAHCASLTSGQGTGLAMIGAYILAGELAKDPTDYQAAFARYEEMMRGSVEYTQRFAENSVKQMVPRSQLSLFFQVQMMRMLAYLPWKNIIYKKIAEDVQKLANGITLPEYTVPEVHSLAS